MASDSASDGAVVCPAAGIISAEPSRFVSPCAWCEPCRAELTTLQQLHAHLRDRYVTIVGVDVGEVDSRVRRFFAERPASFPILLDRDSAASKAWQVSILPTTFLLDSNLVPRFVAEGDVDWARPEIEESVTSLIRQKPAGKTSAF
jgi:peroxiredoxin